MRIFQPAAWALGLYAAWHGLAAAPGAAQEVTPPASLPLVSREDITYNGMFSLPAGSEADPARDLTYGGRAMGLGENHTLYIGAHQQDRLCQITIPEVEGTAEILGGCNTVPGHVGDESSVILGGSLLWNGRLIVSKYIFYDATSSARVSHQAGRPSISGFGSPLRVGTLSPGLYAGYMAVVPPEWRTLLGGPAITGQGVLSIIGRTSFGPAAFAFDPDDLGRENPVPATPLVYYTMEDPIADSNASNELFTRDDKLGGIAFPPGTRSVLFVGTHGTGPPCYGAGTSEDPPPNGACHNPLTGSQGEHSYPYRGQVWAYDANDLVRVREGDLDPWKVRPYAVWPLPGVSEETTRVMRGGVAFDPETGRLYLTEDYGESPQVHVFTIAQPQAQ